jgi:hypothetical protein
MKTVSTRLTRARISSAALALDPIPAQTIKVYSTHNKNAELDKHNFKVASGTLHHKI